MQANSRSESGQSVQRRSRWRALSVPGLHAGLVLLLCGAALMSWVQDSQLFDANPPPALLTLSQVFSPIFVLSTGFIVAGCMLASRFQRTTARTGLAMLCVLLGGLWVQLASFQPGPLDISRQLLNPGESWTAGRQSERTGTVTGEVQSVQPEKNRVVLVVTRWQLRPATGRVQMQFSKKTPLPLLGSTLRATGDLRLPYHSWLPGAFSEARYLRRQQITAVMAHVSSVKITGVSDAPWMRLQRFAQNMRNRIGDVFNRALPADKGVPVAAQVLGGIVLGHHAIPLDAGVKSQFIHTGLIHLLAASGMNVGIIAGVIFLLARLCRLPFVFQCGLAMAAVALYTVLSGMPASVLRAATMLEIALGLKLLRRSLSGPILLGIAASLLLLFQPSLMGDLGFQFSVLSTYGILVMFPPLQQWLGHYMTRWLAGIVLLPLVAQLWVWPLSLFHFNQLPLHTIFLNIAVLALVTPLTVLGFAAGVLGLLWAPLGVLCASLAAPLLAAMLWIVNWGEGMHWAQQTVASPPVWWVAAAYGLLLLFPILIKPPEDVAGESETTGQTTASLLLPGVGAQLLRYGTLAMLILLLPWSLQTIVQRQATQLTWLPLGGGGAGGQAWLMEPAGGAQPVLGVSSGIRFWQGREVASYLRHRNIRHLAAVMVWDGDTRATQAAGLAPVLKEVTARALVLPEALSFLRPKLDELQPGRTVFLSDQAELVLRAPARQPVVAGLSDRTHGRLFSLKSGGFCVEAVAESVQQQENATGCLLRLVQAHPGSPLVWQAPLREAMAGPMRWVLRGEQLVLR